MGDLQLQLGLVNVRLAKPAQPGHDPAPVGMRVWLDVPSSRKFDIDKRSLDPVFQEFEIVADSRDANLRRLKPAGASATAIARIDLSETYWCFWSFGEKLAVENKFQKVPGFGWPLPAPLNSQKDLILPNNRILFLNEFSLSGFDLLGQSDPPARMMANRQTAQKFYQDLHIGLIFREQTSRPKVVGTASSNLTPAPDLFMGVHVNPATNTSRNLLHDVADIKKNLASLTALRLALNEPPLGRDPQDKTIPLIWLKSFVGPVGVSVDGMAITNLPLFPAGQIAAIGDPSVSFSLVFLPLEPGGNLNLAHDADPQQGPAQTQGLGLRDRPAIDDGKGESRSGSPPRDHHACDAAGRNRVHIGISPRNLLRQEANRVPMRSDAPGREQTTARILLHGPTAGRLRFQPSRPAPSLPRQAPNERAETAGTRKRRHPKSFPPLTHLRPPPRCRHRAGATSSHPRPLQRTSIPTKRGKQRG